MLAFYRLMQHYCSIRTYMCSLNAGRHEVGARSHLCFPGNKLLNVGDQLGYVLPEMMIVLHLPLAMVRSIHIPEKQSIIVGMQTTDAIIRSSQI